MEHTVGLFRCTDYNVDSILGVFCDAINRVAFDTASVQGKTVLLKPNMLGAYPPEMGITTHPNFLEAAIILFKELGCKVWVGDSANGIFPIDSVWERTGIRDVCRRHNVAQKVFEREGGVLKDGLLIARPVLETDLVVNLPRFKTHGLTVLTIATKNLYGCVPGMQKTRYHQKMIARAEFAKLVVRISEIAKPAFNLVDGIVAMEGNGPSAGRLVKMNTIVVGTNHHAVDAVCARLIDLDPKYVDTLEAAEILGVWRSSDEINIVGESAQNCRPESFNLPKTFTKGMRDWWISLLVIDRIWGGLWIKPKIDKKKCQRCGLCVEACPVGAIVQSSPSPLVPARHASQGEAGGGEACPELAPNFVEGRSRRGGGEGETPRIIAKNCVQCYCCHEICPYQAIDLNESLGVKIGRFLGERRIKKLNPKHQAPNAK